MKIKSLKLFIKQKKIEIERLSADMVPLKERMQKLEQELQENEKKIQALQERPVQQLFDLTLMHNHIADLHAQNEKIKAKIQKLYEEIFAYKKRLAELFGQKKGLEKLLRRIKEEQRKKAHQEENRLADENYLRKIHTP